MLVSLGLHRDFRISMGGGGGGGGLPLNRSHNGPRCKTE